MADLIPYLVPTQFQESIFPPMTRPKIPVQITRQKFLEPRIEYVDFITAAIMLVSMNCLFYGPIQSVNGSNMTENKNLETFPSTGDYSSKLLK
jgi:hypothetical protein